MSPPSICWRAPSPRPQWPPAMAKQAASIPSALLHPLDDRPERSGLSARPSGRNRWQAQGAISSAIGVCSGVASPPLACTTSDTSGAKMVRLPSRPASAACPSAPNTFLGADGCRARRLMDEGAIGRAVTGTFTAEGPNRNASFRVGTPTNILSLLEFRSGATVTFGASWDVFKHSNHPIELHGTEGSMRLPNPDTFVGTVSLSERGADWKDFASEGELYGARNWPYAAPDRANYRMLGVADLVRSLKTGAVPRASGNLALHVLEIMEAILHSGETKSSVAIAGDVVQPTLLTEDEASSLLA